MYYHCYADDTQLFLSVATDDSGALNSIMNCLSSVEQWMSKTFLKLNEDKTEILVIGTSERRQKIFSKLADQSLGTTERVGSKKPGCYS